MMQPRGNFSSGGVFKTKYAQCHHSYVTRVVVFPCSPLAEGHTESASQGVLKVALSSTFDRVSVFIGRGLALLAGSATLSILGGGGGGWCSPVNASLKCTQNVYQVISKLLFNRPVVARAVLQTAL